MSVKDLDKLGLSTTSEMPKARTKKITSEITTLTRQAELVSLAGTGRGRRYQIKDELIIGRQPASQIWIPDDAVSRRHAKITRTDDGQFHIEDLDSRNGTTVNGLAIKRQLLAFGDKITLGSETVLVFTFTDPLEEQVLQLQKMEAVGRLAAGVAHEFNNLLAVVVTNLGLLKRPGDLKSGEVEACVDEALQAALRGGELTRQLLDFSRVRKTHKSPTNLTELIAEIGQLLNRSFGPAVTTAVEVEPNLVVLGDRLQLYQVLMNLCINAVDATSKKGRILVQARSALLDQEMVDTTPGLKPGPHVELIVKDSGVGMDEETLAKVFDPFFTTKETGKGTGLGLSMTLGLVDGHHGTILVDSAPRRGTTVRVLLPQITSAAIDPDVVPDKEPETPQHDATILIVDDDELVIRSLDRTLSSHGFEVIVASNGREAVQIFEKQHGAIDLVLLDLLMPVLGGQETFSILKRIDPDVRVLICSGYMEEDVVTRMMVGGASGVLTKPFQQGELISSIASALD